MVLTVDQDPNCSVSFDDTRGTRTCNQDAYRFEVKTGSQPFVIEGQEVEEFSFTIVGNWELDAFLEAMRTIAMRRRRDMAEDEERDRARGYVPAGDPWV
jgi:hypothetical protein